MTKNLNVDNGVAKDEVSTKIIFKAYIARALLKRGHKIVDIKPLRDNPERTVFVFADSIKLRDDMSEITKEHNSREKKDSED